VGDKPNRNLVLVTVDSLRADHCGFVNSESDLTPTIDRLAKEGVSYTQAVVPGPRTPSSIPVLFTGEFMADDAEWSMADWQGRQYRIGEHMDRFQHLSEQLQRQGYETAAFTANPGLPVRVTSTAASMILTKSVRTARTLIRSISRTPCCSRSPTRASKCFPETPLAGVRKGVVLTVDWILRTRSRETRGTF